MKKIPMMVGQQVIGVLNAGSTTVAHFTADDLQLMQTLANQAVVNIKNTRLLIGVQRHERELALLNKAGQPLPLVWIQTPY